MKILAGIFATITVAVIGFGYWDRRTTVSKAKEVTLEALATETENPQVRALLEWVVVEVIRRLESRKESQPLSTPLQANV